MTTKNSSIKPKALNKKNTQFHTFIDFHLKQQGKSYTQLVNAANLPKAYITRLKRGQWIPSPSQASKVAAFLKLNWWTVWIACGHINAEEVQQLKSRYVLIPWKLDDLESQMVSAYRFCEEEAANYLISAARGAARASENNATGLARQHKVKVLLEMEFVNFPEWLENVERITMNGEPVYVIKEQDDFPYLAQSTVVGTLRYALTRKFSPLPRHIWDSPAVATQI